MAGALMLVCKKSSARFIYKPLSGLVREERLNGSVFFSFANLHVCNHVPVSTSVITHLNAN
jgi:hypothetical protein